MKKLAMTLCGAALSMAVYAQQLDSINNNSDYKKDFRIQNPSINQATDSQSIYTPQYSPPPQKQTSPIIQQKFQTEPSLQYQQQQPQPGLRLQPLQTNPQIPSQTQPLDLNNNGNQNQLNQRIQPTPGESDTQRPG
jgi:hypothetical protein